MMIMLAVSTFFCNKNMVFRRSWLSWLGPGPGRQPNHQAGHSAHWVSARLPEQQ